MTVHAEIFEAGEEPSALAPALDIRDTHWGFIVTELSANATADFLSEVGLKFVVVVLVLAAGAQWLLPGSLFSGDVILMKLAITAALGSVCLGLFRFANRGFVVELQVDAALREIRIGMRNTAGRFRVQNRIPMRDIEECFVRPAADRDGHTELCFRVSGHAEPIQIAAGSVADLTPVLQRLTRDLRTPRERVTLRMAG
jgi:hypothetical protein